MLELLWIIPALPLGGFLILAIAGRRIPKTWTALVGAGSVGLALAAALGVGISFIGADPGANSYVLDLGTWMSVNGFTSSFSLYLDALSLVTVLDVTFVGFLIHIYSVGFMAEEEGYARFFAYMNLFIGSMLILVLADDLLFLYLGWEGVGLCSYLLIGFWYKDPLNGLAARKAFVVTRIGDASLSIGLFLLATNLGTLRIQEMMYLAAGRWTVGSGMAMAAAALLLGGAIGKSAQLPLQTWLPDAMAGPTPVSALIHAATMVTAGVYLIARTHLLFTLAPQVQASVAVIGALTLVVAGLSAITQRDIKRVLAYSTISQIGYMFLALGVGAWSAAIFHFVTHAFFKALLFLGAGMVIISVDNEHDMFKIGGLRSQLPAVFWTFLVGACSLSALPFVTAGFYSKELIIYYSLASPLGNRWLWMAGVLGAFITSLYTFRMVLITFFGDARFRVRERPGMIMTVPATVLAALSLVAGFIELPASSGKTGIFSTFLGRVLPPITVREVAPGAEATLHAFAAIVSLLGIFLAYILFFARTRYADKLTDSQAGRLIHRFWSTGCGFDWLYDVVIVKPFVRIAAINRDDFIDLIYLGMLWAGSRFSNILSISQTGKVRTYALGIAFGAAIAIAIVVFL